MTSGFTLSFNGESGFYMLGINKFFNQLSGNGVNKRNKQGETKLYRAVRSGNIKEVKKLLRDGADPDIADAHGLTPLHQAAYWGEGEITALLLKAGRTGKCREQRQGLDAAALRRCFRRHALAAGRHRAAAGSGRETGRERQARLDAPPTIWCCGSRTRPPPKS